MSRASWEGRSIFDVFEGWSMFFFWGFFLPMLLVALSYEWGVVRCGSIGNESSLPTKYTLLSGCYVKLGDRWVPEDRWRNLEH